MFDATVIIAAWNAADTVERSIRSAFNQTGIVPEVIVVDDASTDETCERLSTRKDIVFDSLAVNGGPAQARNRALDLARGKWIAVLDADDTMLPERLVRMIDQAEHMGADIVLGNFREVDETGSPVQDRPFLSPHLDNPERPLTLAEYVGRNQVRRGAQSIGYLKPLFSSAFLGKTGLHYDPTLRNGEDCHLIFAALALGAKVVISSEPDYLYTVRRGSVSHRIDPQHLEALIAADAAFLLRHHETLDLPTRSLFESRRKALTEMMISERVLNNLRSGRIVAASKSLAENPKTVLRVVRQIGEGLGRRLKAG